MALLRRSPIVSFLAGVAVLALLGFGIYRVVHRVSKIGSDSATGGADSDSFYRADNFGTAVKAVRGEIGAGGDVLELRIDAKRAKSPSARASPRTPPALRPAPAIPPRCPTSASTSSATARLPTSRSRSPTWRPPR
jgi:hypothetical protein